MRKLIFIMAMSIAVNSNAQVDSTHVTLQSLDAQLKSVRQTDYNAGIYLKKFTGQYYMGMGIAAAGIAVTGIAAATYDEDATLLYAGAALTFTGFVYTLIAHNNIRRAGLIFMGNGIEIPIR